MEFSIKAVAELANLRLTPEEEEQLRGDFEESLRFASALQEPDGPAHEEDEPPFLREDCPAASLTREETLQNAPEALGGCFVLPRAIGGESGG